jgi:hypothetical protein
MAQMSESRLADAIVSALKREGLSKEATINMNGKAVGKAIIRVLDSEFESKQNEDSLAKGGSPW